MSNIEIREWNFEGFTEIRTSPGVRSLVDKHAKQVAEKAGRGFGWEGRISEGDSLKARYRATVFPMSTRARRKNAKHNTLIKALGRAGG